MFVLSYEDGEAIVKFFVDNVLLIGLAFGSGIMLIWPWLMGRGANQQSLSPNEAVMLINRKNAICLDIRDKSAFSQGHISNAKHIPFSELTPLPSTLMPMKSQALILVCQTGAQSAKAIEWLNKSEFQQVYTLDGGMNAWLKAKLPTTKE